MALIGALSPYAREAGGLLVAQLEPDDLDLETVVRLANHEILLVRQGAWALAQAARQRFRVAPIALARLCDARWDDTRAFAFGPGTVNYDDRSVPSGSNGSKTRRRALLRSAAVTQGERVVPRQ